MTEREKIGLLFDKLKVVNTVDIANRTVKSVIIKKEIPEDIAKGYEKEVLAIVVEEARPGINGVTQRQLLSRRLMKARK
jgi:hypothetical protein